MQGMAVALNTAQGQSTAVGKPGQGHALQRALATEGGRIPELEAAFK